MKKPFIINYAATVKDGDQTEKVILRTAGTYEKYMAEQVGHCFEATAKIADFYPAGAKISAQVVSPSKAESLLKSGYIEL